MIIFSEKITILIFVKLESTDNVKLTNRISIMFAPWQKWNKTLNRQFESI